MTEKNAYNAKVRGKGLENTGVTEDLAKTMYGTLGRSTMAIVRLVHKRQINDDDTGRTVELVIDLLEPSTSTDLDEHLRELTRTLHQNRALKADDQQLEINTLDDVEPTVEQVIAAGAQHIAETDDELPDSDEDDEDARAKADEQLTEDWVDSQHGDAPEPEDGWEYDQAEGPREPTTVGSPFGNTTS